MGEVINSAQIFSDVRDNHTRMQIRKAYDQMREESERDRITLLKGIERVERDMKRMDELGREKCLKLELFHWTGVENCYNRKR
jgi:hypothetical protein